MRSQLRSRIQRLEALELLLQGGGSGPIDTISVTAPITTTGGANPTLGILAATESAAGSLSAADKTKLDNIFSQPSLTQTTWFIDRVNGLPTNSGLDASHPVDSAATIRLRWTGGIPGGRPRLPPGTKLVLQGNTPTVPLSGTLATASAFARTSAGGQISITDGSVADFHPFVPALFHDITTGAVAFLYEPQSAGATGIVTHGRTAAVEGSFATPTPVAINGGDAYELLTMTSVYMGASSTTQLTETVSSGQTVTITWLNGAVSQPDVADPVAALLDADGIAQFVIYRLHFTAQSGTDTWFPYISGGPSSINAIGLMQECLFDQLIKLESGALLLKNVGLASHGVSSAAIGNSILSIFAGFTYAGLFCDFGGEMTADGDLVMDGNVFLSAGSTNSNITVGNFSRWGTTGPAFNILRGASISFQNVFEATHIQYGKVGSANVVIAMESGTYVKYTGAGTAVATFQYDSNVTNWSFLASGSSGFGIDETSGLYVGPTTNTWAHLDAARGAGTGFGSLALDPGSFAIIQAR